MSQSQPQNPLILTVDEIRSKFAAQQNRCWLLRCPLTIPHLPMWGRISALYASPLHAPEAWAAYQTMPALAKLDQTLEWSNQNVAIVTRSIWAMAAHCGDLLVTKRTLKYALQAKD